jgi:hypothetical protein
MRCSRCPQCQTIGSICPCRPWSRMKLSVDSRNRTQVLWFLRRPTPRPRDCFCATTQVRRSLSFFHSSIPAGLVPVFTRPYGCTVSDCSRVAYTPPSSPCPRSSLSLALGSFGFLLRPTPPDLVPAFARPCDCSCCCDLLPLE